MATLDTQTVKIINLKNNDSTVECDYIVREIPLKRIVYRGRFLNKNVFIKLFIDSRSKKRHKELELKGLQKLALNNIAAPKVLFSGLTEQGDPIIITLEISGGVSLSDAWKAQSKEEDRLALMNRLMELIATHHNAGLQHNDPHPKNFFVSTDTIYTLDGADIIARKEPLERTPSLNNLAFIIAQFQPDNDNRALSLLPKYCKVRNWLFEKGLQQQTLNIIHKKREIRKNKYLKKIYRECTKIASFRASGNLQLIARDFNNNEMRSLLEFPDSSLDEILDRNAAIKKGNSSTVAKLEINTSSFVIKRYNIKNPLHYIKRAFTKSRAERSWENAHLLEFYSIPTAQPVAIRINKTGPFRGRAWYVAEYLPGQTLMQFVADNENNTKQIKNIAAQVAKIITSIAKQLITHGDLKATNFQVCHGKVYLIDLDSMKQHRIPRLFEPHRKKDLERLQKNWATMPKIEALFHQAISKHNQL